MTIPQRILLLLPLVAAGSYAVAAHAALFIRGGVIDDAYRCCVYADMAFDRSPLIGEDHFREWLLDVAVLAAFEDR
jgi:hypothetical protein